MPYSSRRGKDFTREVVERLYVENGQTLKILDLGAGSGTYPRLFQHSALDRQRCLWHGVEIWAPYVERFGLRELYDTLWIADIRDQHGPLSELTAQRYDLALVGDVLEHISLPDATRLFHWLGGFCARLILSIPIVYYPQEESEGNPYERHVVDDWSHDKILDWLAREFPSVWQLEDYRCYKDVGVYVIGNLRRPLPPP